MGTPAFATSSLAALIAAGHEIAAVYTQPPRPAGRGKALRLSPVHEAAQEAGLSVRAPENFKSDEERAAFAALGLDVAVVVAYGLILPRAVLNAPRLGCINLHGSLLPRWRGAAPIQRAIMAGDDETGVQAMQMAPGLDTGPILMSEAVSIESDDTAGSLHDRLADVGAQLLPRVLAALESGGLEPTPQDSEGVVYAHKIDKSEARVDWTEPGLDLDRKIRGLSPNPGAWFEADGRRVKALLSAPANGTGAPGEVLQADGRLVIACGEGAVELKRLQQAGKAAQSAPEFLRGFPLAAGDRLG
ncbi:MAG: methionyl-tRNA formyltransferase [Pseudomonadota bacterium]